MFQIGDSFIKQRTPVYRDIYDTEKARQIEKHLNGECERCNKLGRKDKPGHPDAMARRKAVKIFLSHYWLEYRKLEGLPISKPWVIAHGGHVDLIKP